MLGESENMESLSCQSAVMLLMSLGAVRRESGLAFPMWQEAGQ
jgi:hypothetical protein